MQLPMMTSPLGRLPLRWRIAIVGLYLAVILPLLMYFNVGLTPDSLVFVFLGAALLVGRPLMFVRDWGVFLLIVVLWQQTGPMAKWAGFPLHMNQLIIADRAIMSPLLHGQLPQIWLQQHLYHYGHWQWYDVLSVVVYGLHFPAPLIVGFAIWLRSRKGFQRYATAYLVLAALAFVGYIVFPAVPPWMAASKGGYFAIPHLDKIFSEFNQRVLTHAFGHHYKQVLDVKYDLTAAMPSLHAAFPLLSALYLRKTFGNWGLLMLGYSAIVWFAVVYMAEHWVVDVLAGLGCTVVAYAVVEAVAWAWQRRRERRQITATEAVASAASSYIHSAGHGR